jgi:hypothetical protein
LQPCLTWIHPPTRHRFAAPPLHRLAAGLRWRRRPGPGCCASQGPAHHPAGTLAGRMGLKARSAADATTEAACPLLNGGVRWAMPSSTSSSIRPWPDSPSLAASQPALTKPSPGHGQQRPAMCAAR